MRYGNLCLAVLLGLVHTSVAPGQSPLPGKVDLTAEFNRLALMPQVQGADTCSLHAVASLAEFELAERDPRPHAERSTEFLIWAAKKATGKDHDQAMFYEAVFGLNRFGICREALMPEVGPGHARHPPSAAALADAKQQSNRWEVHWIKRWDLKRPLDDAQIRAIKEALAHGHPVACGLRWPKTLKGHELIQVPPPNAVEDGHSIALVGYTDDPQHHGVFLFRNSWGPHWGKNGYGSMSYAYTRAYANDALWLELGPPNSEVPVERFEAAALSVIASGRCRCHPQDMAQWEKALWSRGKQLFCGAEKEGFVELALEVRQPGRYRLRVLATAAPDFGTIRMALDGRWLEPQFDLYCGRVSPSGTLELGTHGFTAGRHRIRFSNTGKNAASAGYSFGIDAIDLLPHVPSR
ncbi:MAG: C1 family peptidase [Thermoguttaceae bacterium]